MNTARTSTTTIVIAEWVAKPSEEEAVGRALAGLAAASRAEEGNLDYRVYVNTEDRASYLLLEEYVDREALDAHRASAHFEEIAKPVIAHWLVSRRARVVTEPTS